MPDAPSYTVIPVSAIKAQASALLDTLAAGRTVYVSKHGRVQTAFLPDPDPDLATVAASPILELESELSARVLNTVGASKAVDAAAKGLPSLVTRSGHLHAVLAPVAGLPAQANAPTPEFVGARSEAVLAFQNENPKASLADLERFEARWTAEHGHLDDPRLRAVHHAITTGTLLAPLVPDLDLPRPETSKAWISVDTETVQSDLDEWRRTGSPYEDLAAPVLERIATSGGAGRLRRRASSYGLDRRPTARAGAIDPFAPYLTYEQENGPAALLRLGERFQAARHVLEARGAYLTLVATGQCVLPAAWRLGDLARSQERDDEAAAWYAAALDADIDIPDRRGDSTGLAEPAGGVILPPAEIAALDATHRQTR